MGNEMKRRDVIKSSLTAGTLLSAPLYVPQTVFGANENPVMGIIGSGGRGCGVMNMHQRVGIKFVAVNDVSEPGIANGIENAKHNNDGEIAVYKDFRRLLERKDIDAVLIATPEHQHCSQMIAAVQAGKDVYCEKPMSHSIEEGAKTIREVRKTNCIVQIGMQRRSAPMIHEALKVLKTGILGDITMVNAHWNWQRSGPLDNSPLGYEIDWNGFQWPHTNVEFEPKKVRNWRVFWPFSGGISCDQGTHIMDVIQWFMGDVTPMEADGFGENFSMTGAETPDALTTLFHYKNFIATWSINYNTAYYDRWHIRFMGKIGTLHVHSNGFQVYMDKDKVGDFPKNPTIDCKGELPTDPHVENFIECLKSRKEPNAPVEVGHHAVCGPHLANVAFRNNRRAKLNPDATEITIS